MNVTPSTADLKQDLATYVNKATILIHSPQASQSILQMIDGTPQSIAKATVMIMQRMDAAARSAGVEVQDFVKCLGANVIVHLLAELGEAGGKAKLDDKALTLALSIAIQDYIKGEIQYGRIDPKKLNATMQRGALQAPPNIKNDIRQTGQQIQQTAQATPQVNQTLQ